MTEFRDRRNRHQELVAAIRHDILAVGSIYRTVGDALFDEAIERMAERIAATVKHRLVEETKDLLEACEAALLLPEICQEIGYAGEPSCVEDGMPMLRRADGKLVPFYCFGGPPKRQEIVSQIREAIAKVTTPADTEKA